MPDFDVDFCYERRPEVIDYVVRKYGADHVAQIVTFGTMLARGAVRDVGRAMGLAYPQVDAVAKLIPNELHMTIDKALEANSELRAMCQSGAHRNRQKGGGLSPARLHPRCRRGHHPGYRR